MISREIDLVQLRAEYVSTGELPNHYALYAPRINARFAQRLRNAQKEEAQNYFISVDAYVAAAATYAGLLENGDEQ